MTRQYRVIFTMAYVKHKLGAPGTERGPLELEEVSTSFSGTFLLMDRLELFVSRKKRGKAHTTTLKGNSFVVVDNRVDDT